MPGLVSLLDRIHDTVVEKIWQELEIDCELTGVAATSLPHFSWQIADDYNWAVVEEILQEIVMEFQSFSVKTNGLGLFTAENPVAYAPIVRTKHLSEFHEMIWNRLTPFSTNPSLYYSPPIWMPHITLAYGDLDTEKLPCLLEKLAFQPIHWEIDIDNLAIVDNSEGVIGRTRYKYRLGLKDSQGLGNQ